MQLLLELSSPVQISRQDLSYRSIQVLRWATGLTSTPQKLHCQIEASFWILVAAATEDALSACHNTSLSIALPIASCSVDPLSARSSFLCIDTSEICIYHLNPWLEPKSHGKYKAPLRAVVHPISMSCSDSYAWYTLAWCCMLSSSALRLAYCWVMLWSHGSEGHDAFHQGGLGAHKFWLCIRLETQEGIQISTRREEFSGGSAVLPSLSKGFEIELSDLKAQNMTLKWDSLWEGVQIGIRGIPTVLEICVTCLFISLGGMLLQGSLSTNLFCPMFPPADLWKVEVSI